MAGELSGSHIALTNDFPGLVHVFAGCGILTISSHFCWLDDVFSRFSLRIVLWCEAQTLEAEIVESTLGRICIAGRHETESPTPLFVWRRNYNDVCLEIYSFVAL